MSLCRHCHSVFCHDCRRLDLDMDMCLGSGWDLDKHLDLVHLELAAHHKDLDCHCLDYLEQMDRLEELDKDDRRHWDLEKVHWVGAHLVAVHLVHWVYKKCLMEGRKAVEKRTTVADYSRNSRRNLKAVAHRVYIVCVLCLVALHLSSNHLIN